MIAAASAAQTSIKCSQLSSTTSARWPLSCSTSAASALPRSGKARPGVDATSDATSSGSASGASCTSHAPCSNAAARPRREFAGKPALARPAGPAEGQQPRADEQPLDFAELPLATDEAGRLMRHIVPPRRRQRRLWLAGFGREGAR
jgi:hypothetical protein